MSGQAAEARSADPSHNLLGQRLGRKGRDTRERILTAAEALLADRQAQPISLSAVAREASLAMTTLYLYFSDLTELLLAVLAPVMESAEGAYLGKLRERWPDGTLGPRCLDFVAALHGFWKRHARILHLRNSYAGGDERMVRHRIASARPMIRLLAAQMDADPEARASLKMAMATVLVTGLERVVTVATDAEMYGPMQGDTAALLRGEARLLELGIRAARAT